MLKIYRDGGDIHAMTAAAVMGISLEKFMELDEETREQKRFQAKAVALNPGSNTFFNFVEPVGL